MTRTREVIAAKQMNDLDMMDAYQGVLSTDIEPKDGLLAKGGHFLSNRNQAMIYSSHGDDCATQSRDTECRVLIAAELKAKLEHCVTPVVTGGFGAWQLSIPTTTGAHELYRDLRDIACGKRVLPETIQYMLLPGQVFEATNMQDFRLPELDDILPSGTVNEEFFNKSLEIHEATRECVLDNVSRTASKNAEVHVPLLRLALRGEWRSQGIWYRDVTTAQISDSSLLPFDSDEVCFEPQVVDYAIYVNCSLAHLRISGKFFLNEDESMNHIIMDSISHVPIAISIVTLSASEDKELREVDLLIGVSAHFARLKRLVEAQGMTVKLPMLPLLPVHGQTWYLKLAEPVQHSGAYYLDRIVVHGDMMLGSTESVLGIHQIVASSRRLARWVSEDCIPWLEEQLFKLE